MPAAPGLAGVLRLRDFRPLPLGMVVLGAVLLALPGTRGLRHAAATSAAGPSR